MNRLLPITELVDVGLVASDFRELLARSDNSDITREFPGLSSRYTREGDGALDEIKYSQDRVAGGAPNLSGFIANPYRGLGLGRLSLEYRPDIVNQRFDRKAWISVSRLNKVSRHLVQSVGFDLVTESGDRLLFSYDASLSDGY